MLAAIMSAAGRPQTRPTFHRKWVPLTTAETERKIDMAREEGEAVRMEKAKARRERRALARSVRQNDQNALNFLVAHLAG